MQRQLLDIERAGWHALSSGTATEFYDRLLASQAAMVVPGMVLDRQQTLDSWESVPPWHSYELSDERVQMLADNVGLVTYEATARRAGEEPYRARFTSIYVADGDEWRLTFHQQTPMG